MIVYWSLAIFFYIFCDGFTTYYFIKKYDSIIEKNPVISKVSQKPAHIVSLKIIVLPFLYLFISNVPHYKKELLLFIALIGFIATVNNLIVYYKVKNNTDSII